MSKNLHCHSFGDDRQPPVLLIHGWMVSSRLWSKLAPLLSGFRLIMPDLRGCGGSPAFDGPVSLDTHIEDLLRLCERLELTGCHLVGHSMGGQLAMLLAAAVPKRFLTVTVMNPVPVDGLSLPEEVQPLFRDAGGNPDAFRQILDMACLSLADDDRNALLEDALRIGPDVIGGTFDAWMHGKPGISLHTATMPATVISTDDPFLPPAFLETAVVQRLPRAELRHLRGPGHYPQLESVEKTAELLRECWA